MFHLKKIIFLLVLSSIMFTNKVNAQVKRSTSLPGVRLSIQPIYILSGGIGGGFDYLATEKFSLGLSGIYLPQRKSGSESGNSYNWGYSELSLNSQYMLTGSWVEDGFYLSGSLGAFASKITNYGSSQLKGELNTYFVRATAGYQWVYTSGLTFGFGTGYLFSPESEIVVRESNGTEVIREKTQAGNGMVVDIRFSFLF